MSFCGWIKPCSLPPAAPPPAAVLSPSQTPCMCPSTSLRVHRSSPSTAGMGMPSSSTSTCQRTPCCCAGSCRHPGERALSAPAWRSLCMYVLCPCARVCPVGFLCPRPGHSWLGLVVEAGQFLMWFLHEAAVSLCLKL